MPTNVEKDFYRLFMLIHKIVLPVVRALFVSFALESPEYKGDIVTFLEINKHEFFHLKGEYVCCKCKTLPLLQRKPNSRLGQDQFKKLYEVKRILPNHFLKGSNGKVLTQCLCCISVRTDSDPKTYDISLLINILSYCDQLTDNHKLYLDKIRICRNRICHLNDITDLPKHQIKTLLEDVEFYVLKLAADVPPHNIYKESIQIQADLLKDGDYNRQNVMPIIDAMQTEMKNVSYLK